MNLKALVLAVSLAGSVISVGAASAHDIDNCSGTSTCLFDYNNWQNKVAGRTHGEGTIEYVGDGANNKMGSWANNSDTYKSCGYDGSNGTGDQQEWNENSHDSDVAPWNNNEVSGWRTKYGC